MAPGGPRRRAAEQSLLSAAAAAAYLFAVYTRIRVPWTRERTRAFDADECKGGDFFLQLRPLRTAVCER